MASTQPSKKQQKRKSDAANLGNTDVQVVVEESSTSAGPAFVNFPSIRPSKNTPFTIYTRDVGSSSDLTKQHTIIAGETEDVEFFSTNRDHNLNTEGADCQYLPALYDPSTGTVHIHPSTPLYLLTHGVKRLRSSVNSLNTGVNDPRAHWKIQRNDLGETFGTRKAKTQIRAEERNKVDVGAMQGVKGHLMGSIPELEVKSGPTEASENIPVPNLTTSDPTEVYPRDSLISPSEWQSIDIKGLVHAEDEESRQKLLPHRKRSNYLLQRIRITLDNPDKAVRNTQLKYIYYLSSLLSLYENANKLSKIVSSNELINKSFNNIPKQLLDGIIIRFSELSGGRKHDITDKMKTKLLAWICVLFLVIDGYNVETGRIAHELKLSTTKIETIYKSLGCSVAIATPVEREKQGISLTEASKSKKAILKAPVVFPKIKRAGPVKR